ncbi:MAG TPA: hypothetical protein VGF69_09590 [Thermoanaerobaculia bacterium]|jgi:tetratricopeptide (TPR) repeat protein
MTRHLHEHELLACAESDLSAASEDIRAHLAVCEACRALLEKLRAIDDELRSKDVWILCEDLRAMTIKSLASLLRTAAEVDAARERAATVLRPLLTSPSAFDQAHVTRDARLHSGAGVQLLCDAAEQQRERLPVFGLDLATAASTIASKLLGQRSMYSLLGRAETERAIALIAMGRLSAADDALQRAEVALDKSEDVTDWEYARVHLTRAILSTTAERYAEAIAQATAAAEGFLAAGDVDRYLRARVAQVSALLARRDYTSAAALAEEVLTAAKKSNNKLLLGRAYNNAGLSHDGLGLLDSAMAFYSEAAALWDELDVPVESSRTDWSIASLLLREGMFVEAVEQLALIPPQFEALGMANDAALARLELAEALLLAERPGEVASVLDGVTMHFTHEGLTHSANLAVAYLREAMANDSVSPHLLRYVRSYLEQLSPTKQTPFVPLR